MARNKKVGPQVVSLLQQGGLSYAQIARKANCSTATVAYHAEKQGLARGGIRENPNPRLAIDWTLVQTYYDEGHGVKACKERFGFSNGAWATATNYGDIVPRQKLRRKPLHEYLILDSELTSVTKKLLIQSRGDVCEECGINEWLSKRLSLDVHHINENHRDNRPENLRVLCPNCHRQQQAPLEQRSVSPVSQAGGHGFESHTGYLDE